MNPAKQSSLSNLLLKRLPADAFALLAGDLVPVVLDKAKVLVGLDGYLDNAYFLERGIGTMVDVTPERHRVEVGVFGFEGMSSTPLLLGVEKSPHETFMQTEGFGHRISASVLVQATETNPTLRRRLLHYCHFMSVQISSTAISNAVQSIDERLARWILMCDDRTPDGEIVLTHDNIAIMLAVRRPSVTTSLHVLEGYRFIRAERGIITVRDRGGLEKFAHNAYGKPEAEYERLLGSLRPNALDATF